jgi:RNA polymerase sigma-70 factor (ECF subfamily)
MDRQIELGLVRALKQGDEAAFDTIYEAHRSRLFGFLVRLCRDRDVAEELLEETWLRLVSKAHLLADDSRLLPWLLTVARNLFLSHRRSRLLDAERVQELAYVQSLRESGESPFAAAAGSELERQVERALATLPLRYREVLLLVALEGLTPSEAATVCEVTPEAMRQRLSRARGMLARKLEEQGVDTKTNKARSDRDE